MTRPETNAGHKRERRAGTSTAIRAVVEIDALRAEVERLREALLDAIEEAERISRRYAVKYTGDAADAAGCRDENVLRRCRAALGDES